MNEDDKLSLRESGLLFKHQQEITTMQVNFKYMRESIDDVKVEIKLMRKELSDNLKKQEHEITKNTRFREEFVARLSTLWAVGSLIGSIIMYVIFQIISSIFPK